jgi:hypothetical protein|tara:strand:- start:4771 stop:5382 length:612 start_codon:yes stop_codon:yes gene_type:complete
MRRVTAAPFVLSRCVGRWHWLCLIILLCTLAAPHPIYAASPSKEQALRAAVILGILKYTQWPEHVGQSKRLQLCSVGNPSSSSVFELKKDSLPKWKSTQLYFARWNNPEQYTHPGCDAIVVGPDIQEIPTLDGQSIHPMLICDNCSETLTKNSTITLELKNNRIQFAVNMDQAEQHHLAFSSALLELASACHSTQSKWKGCQR